MSERSDWVERNCSNCAVGEMVRPTVLPEGYCRECSVGVGEVRWLRKGLMVIADERSAGSGVVALGEHGVGAAEG